MPKINSTKEKTQFKINNNENHQPTDDNIIILEAIEQSKFGSSCGRVGGPSCSVERVNIEQYELPHIALGLDKAMLLDALRLMLLSRYTDEKHLTLVKQGKSFFHIGCSGHEAVQIAIGLALTSKKDWAWPYYRDGAFMYAIGQTPREYFLLALAKQADPASGGRQMPNHYGNPALNIPSQSSPTGTQYLNAVGNALAAKKLGTDEIVYVSSGEGTTSQGEFYEAVNWASREHLPVLFCIQDNGWAISVPRETQSMGSTVGHSFCCYSSLKMKTFDGTDFFESYKAAVESVEFIHTNKIPVLLHAMVERLMAHSSSDDQRKYRPSEELEQARLQKDCIVRLKDYILTKNISSQDEIDELSQSVRSQVDDAVDWALQQPDGKPEESTLHVYAPDSTRRLGYATTQPAEGNKVVMVDAINHALHEEMARNEKMLIFGEDIADPKGGVFTATKGLSKAFGIERVFNTPLAEASIIGVAIGLAVRGFKPVVEIQFGDYIWPSFNQLRNELATMRYRSNGGFSCPVVVRVPVGGYIHGGLCHSQNIEAFFAHIPGLLVAYPSTAADAKGLLKTACRIEDPVIFCEHKGMYRLPFSTTPEPGSEYLVEFGNAKIVKSGDDLTVITYGMGVRDSVLAAKKIESELGRSIEIIDLRTIIPWDKPLVLESVKKTGRALIVHEDTITCGFGAELASTVSQEAFRWLDAPVTRLAAKDSPIPYAPVYEEDVLPNEKKVYDAMKKIIQF